MFIDCAGCGKRSMHLSFTEITVSVHPSGLRFNVEEIDDHIFYSVPSSYHVIDANIPSQLRELFDEAQGCMKSNFLTGASACARKLVYELGKREGAEGDHYDDRIKSLKEKFPEVDPTYFDTLLTVHELTSSKVHENAYDGWESKHLHVIMEALRNVLHEIYVAPKRREQSREAMLELKKNCLVPLSQ